MPIEYRTRLPGGVMRVVRYVDGWKKVVTYEPPKKKKKKDS